MVSEKALDDFEVAVRARVDQLEDEVDRLGRELSAAREALSRVEVTRATLAEVVASQTTTMDVAVVGSGPSAGTLAALDRAARVPVWREGLTAAALPDCYRPLLAQLAASPGPVRCAQVALALGLDPVPGKIEGVRSKLKRLVARGWAVEETAGLFAARAG